MGQTVSDERPKARLTVADCEDPDAWNAFVERSGGPPFSLWGWGEATESYGHESWRLVAREGDEILGALPLHLLRSRLFGTKLVSPPFGERGSVIVGARRPDDASERLLERTRALADELGVDFVSLRGCDLGECRHFEKRNRFVTIRTPVGAGPESAWDGMRGSRQRQVRQARENEALEVATGESLSDLREFYRLHLRSMRGHGTPPHSFRFFRILWDRLGRAGHLTLRLVRKDGEAINGIIDLAAGSTVYQWGVVSDYEFRELNGGSLLTWKSLAWAAENGYDAYEFGRTREGSGVYIFKKSFGGSKTWYDDYHYFPGGGGCLPNPEKDAYEPVKRVWRRLPLALTRAVGPRIRRSISL